MKNFKRFLTICAFAGIFGTSINVKAATEPAKPEAGSIAQPVVVSEASKAILSKIQELTASLDIDEAKAIYIDDMKQDVEKMKKQFALIDWASLLNDIKMLVGNNGMDAMVDMNAMGQAMGQMMDKLMQKINAPEPFNFENSVTIGACIKRVKKHIPEFEEKIQAATSQNIGKLWTKIIPCLMAMLPLLEGGFGPKQLTEFNSAFEELAENNLKIAMDILYPASTPAVAPEVSEPAAVAPEAQSFEDSLKADDRDSLKALMDNLSKFLQPTPAA